MRGGRRQAPVWTEAISAERSWLWAEFLWEAAERHSLASGCRIGQPLRNKPARVLALPQFWFFQSPGHETVVAACAHEQRVVNSASKSETLQLSTLGPNISNNSAGGGGRGCKIPCYFFLVNDLKVTCRGQNHRVGTTSERNTT